MANELLHVIIYLTPVLVINIRFDNNLQLKQYTLDNHYMNTRESLLHDYFHYSFDRIMEEVSNLTHNYMCEYGSTKITYHVYNQKEQLYFDDISNYSMVNIKGQYALDNLFKDICKETLDRKRDLDDTDETK